MEEESGLVEMAKAPTASRSTPELLPHIKVAGATGTRGRPATPLKKSSRPATPLKKSRQDSPLPADHLPQINTGVKITENVPDPDIEEDEASSPGL